MICTEQFKEIFPNCSEPDEWVETIKKTSLLFSKSNTIKTFVSIPRMAAFISQCGHESGGWRVFSENLNYSSDALNRVFPKYFSLAGRDSSEYHRNPEKIANVVYSNRMGNGDAESGDGWKYRGRGPIQLTGKTNYMNFQKFISNFSGISLFSEIKNINVVTNPELISTNKMISILSAIWFWETNKLNELSDVLNIKKQTKKINGGLNGLSERIHIFLNCLEKMVGVVKIGQTGDNVKFVQQLLGVSQDGVFGKMTESALKSKQKELGLLSDGICGAKTIKKLTSLIINSH